MRESEPCDDAHRTWKLRAALHDTGLVTHSDKSLAAGNKTPNVRCTYKARQFNREPGLAQMELTTEKRARTPGKMGMEKDRKTIAIIDDDNGIRQALKRVLTAAGFSVHMFASAEDFLASMNSCAAGCAVVDLELGKMSGFELACHPDMVAAKIPIIFISGTADETARASAMALGCVEYLRKPFMPIELLGAILRATQGTPQTS